MFCISKEYDTVTILKISMDEKTRTYIKNGTNWKISIPIDVYELNKFKDEEKFLNLLDKLMLENKSGQSLPNYIRVLRKCYLTE